MRCVAAVLRSGYAFRPASSETSRDSGHAGVALLRSAAIGVRRQHLLVENGGGHVGLGRPGCSGLGLLPDFRPLGFAAASAPRGSGARPGGERALAGELVWGTRPDSLAVAESLHGARAVPASQSLALCRAGGTGAGTGDFRGHARWRRLALPQL